MYVGCMYMEERHVLFVFAVCGKQLSNNVGRVAMEISHIDSFKIIRDGVNEGNTCMLLKRSLACCWVLHV